VKNHHVYLNIVEISGALFTISLNIPMLNVRRV